MAETTTRAIRRGLPRVRGGEPWPPEAEVQTVARVARATDAPAGQATAAPAPAAEPAAVAPGSDAAPAATAQAAGAAPAAAAAAPTRVRRGLPRVAGGAPWPQVDEAALAALAPAAAPAPAPAAAAASAAPETPAAGVAVAEATPEAAAFAAAAAAGAETAAAAPVAVGAPVPTRLRRGLPRVAGGPAWPQVDDAALEAARAKAAAAAPAAAPAATVAAAAPAATAPAPAAPAPAAASAPAAPAAAATPATPAAPRQGLGAKAAPAAAATAPARPAAPAQASVTPSAQPAAEPRLYRGLTLSQWVWRSIGGAAAIVVFVGLVMLAARGLLTFQWASDFVKRYPGSYELPKSAPVGFPLWVEWQHFLNAFFMLLIIRTGIQIRRETKPPANWSPRWNTSRRISLTVWLHQSLDLLWFVNGIAFVVALFATGQWMRVIPTSWSVFPNAISAALKYASMNWPTEDGWVNYNSLQQLSYFAVIFLLAPLAAVTGVRMSGLWQKKWERASRVYPIQLARAIHFPTMVAFSVFIVIHVVLVFATGALRNLNHMYGHSDVVSWTGFWLFVVALAVMVAGWIAARPLVTAPIASLFGKVGR